MAANPIEKDALTGPSSLEILARVAAQHGRARPRHRRFTETTLDTVRWLIDTIMPLTPALLRLDPMFDPLRNDPRFQKLVASPAPR